MTNRKLFSLALCMSLGIQGAMAQEYFQQEVDYKIDVSLDDKAHVLNGMMEMVYKNKSSADLDFIYFHLWPNAYADFQSELSHQLDEMGQLNYHFSDASERGNIAGMRWTVDGVEATFISEKGASDHGKLRLPEPLKAGSSCVIRTPFQVKIPSGAFSRLGHVGQSYQITQWYPKPAVFDNKGWHPMPYLTQGEFYSEFGSFEVSITLPKNYIVGATGVLQNQEEYAYMKSLSTRKAIQDSNDFPPSSAETKTLTYTQDKVHDFAWFADKRFNVLYDTVELPDSKERIDAWVLYTNKHKEAWQKSMEYVKDGIIHYSKYVGDYPYSHATVIDGTLSAGGGMEYPMITVINGTSNDMALEQVVVHELGHNWFYGILGSNERDHAWMDEGVNTYYETRYFEEKYPGNEGGFLARFGINGRQLHEIGYLYNARKHQDQGLETGSAAYTTMNYGVMVYSKGGYIMHHLASVLGQEEFDKAMHSYFNDWKFKHPYPEDMQASLERATGKDMTWFFQDLACGTKKLDYSMKGHTDHDDPNTFKVQLREKSGSSSPVVLGLIKDGACIEEKVLKPGEEIAVKKDEVDELLVDPEHRVLDMSRKNNVMKTHGLFKACQGPQLKFLTGMGHADVPTLYLLPVIGLNGPDGWMPGLSLSNMEVLSKDFEYSFMPMYGMNSKMLTGLAHVNKRFFPSEGPSHFDIGANAKRFGTGFTFTIPTSGPVIPDVNNSLEFDMVAEVYKPYLAFTYMPASLKKGVHELSYTAHILDRRFPKFNEPVTSADGLIIESLDVRTDVFHELAYTHSREKALRSTFISGMIEGHAHYLKAEASLQMNHIYNEKKDKIRWRVYGAKIRRWDFGPVGAMLNLNGQDGTLFGDGSSSDYRYDGLFFNRASENGFASQQIIRNRGGFTQSSPYGLSDNWVSSLNVEADLPIPLPLSAYGNVGFYHSRGSVNASKGNIEQLVELGIRLHLIRDLVDVSFPLILSQEVKDYYADFDISYGQTIRFQFRMEKMNLRTVRNAIDL